jgi:hypothetical protein
MMTCLAQVTVIAIQAFHVRDKNAEIQLNKVHKKEMEEQNVLMILLCVLADNVVA